MTLSNCLAANVRKQLLLHPAGLPKPISMQICASGETADFDKVMECTRLLRTIDNLIQNSPAVKKVCIPQEGHCEKRCEIQGGSQEMA